MTLQKRLAEQNAAGKIQLVRQALTLLMAQGDLGGDDLAAARFLDRALAERMDGAAMAAEWNRMGLSSLESTMAFVAGLLQHAAAGKRRSATQDAELAIDSIARRVDRLNPALARAIRSVEIGG